MQKKFVMLHSKVALNTIHIYSSVPCVCAYCMHDGLMAVVCSRQADASCQYKHVSDFANRAAY